MRNNQDASGGDNSTFNQAARDITHSTINYYGMGYTEIKDLFMDLFHTQFLKLGEDVENLINERAEKVIIGYLNKLVEEDPNLIQNTKNPDIRYGIIEAQKAYARFGNTEMADLLIDVLVQRTKAEDSFSSIVLNEALTVIPKLTKLQINILTVLYAIETISYVNPTNNSISTFYDAFLSPFLDERLIPKNEHVYLYLQSCGCLTIIIGAKLNLGEAFHKKFKGKYQNLEIITKEIRENSKLDTFEKEWSGNALLSRCTLSSVGLAIGLANFNLTTGNNFKLEHHIYE